MDFFEIVRGPFLWIAFIIFIAGMIYNLYDFFKKVKRDPVFYKYLSFKHIIRSYFFWCLPFGSYSMRNKPWFTLVSYVFHIGVVLVPIFFLGHIELWNESWGIRWKSFPNIVSDTLTISTLLCGMLLLARKIFVRDVRYLSSFSDYVFLILIVLVFLTGFLARYQFFFDYKVLVILHMLLGEILLVIFPFTRFSHIVYFWLIRAYTASEFGAVRRSRDY